MTGLDQIREAVADYLNQNGVKAVTAWAAQPRDGAGAPVCAVSLRRCEAVASATTRRRPPGRLFTESGWR